VDLVFEPSVPLKAGALELLDHLDERRLLKAVVTSTERPTAEDHLRRAGVLDRFDVLITRNETERGKPHPDPYLKATAELGIAPARCLTLEDSHAGVRSAHAAGTMTVMIPDLLSCTDELRALCVAVLKDLHEVRELVFGG
jgi:HAD superfamily hydrolase (TIGR01509 family)